MQEMKKLFNNKMTKTVLLFVTVVSIIFNLYLATMVAKLDDHKVSDVDSTTEIAKKNPENLSDEEAIIIALEEQIKDLNVKLEGNNNSEDQSIKDNRTLIKGIADNFSNDFLSFDSKTDINKRELFKEYMTVDLLNAMAPENPAPSTNGTEESELIDVENIDYVQEIENINIFLPENISEDLIPVLVRANVKTTINEHSNETKELLIDLKLKKEEGKYRVSNFYQHDLN